MAKITVTAPGTTVMVGDGDTVRIDIAGGGDVTIIADPNDNVEKVKIEFINDSEADTVNVDLSTFSENDLHIDIKHYDPTDTIQLQGAFNSYVDPDHVDEYSFDYVGSDGQTYSGFVHAKDGNEKDFTDPNPPIIICFGEGTMIETVDGSRPVETLRAGELVKTKDCGFEPIKWIGKRTLDWLTLTRSPHLRPIIVRRDAFGTGCPAADLVLSPNHRILVSDWRAQLFFGEDEVLVPVKSLVDGKGVFVDHDAEFVTYHHLLLDGHQIISSNGLLSESLFLADQSLKVLSRDAISAIRTRIGAKQLTTMSQARSVRPLVRHRESLCLAALRDDSLCDRRPLWLRLSATFAIAANGHLTPTLPTLGINRI